MQPQDGGVERDVCDKLLMLCDMFGVTLDDLVMGDVCASAGRGGAGRVGCVDAGRMDLAADTAGVAASDGVVDSAVGAVPGVIGFAASQVAGVSDSAESDTRGGRWGRLEPVNTNQKSPSDSGANHPTGNSCNPLLGHATSHAATLIGLFAIVLWGFMAGLVRLVSESFGATLGSALIYTVGGVMLFIVRRPKPIREAPCKYLIAGGLMFIAYEASISLSIGLATTNAQSVEVSLVNYLWPTLLVLMTAAVSHKRGAVAKAIPGAVIATIGVAMAVGGESLDMQEAVHNIASNPLPYVLAFVGAFIWAIYATFTPSLSGGYDGTTIFFCCVAVVLWTIHFVSGDGLPDTAPGIGGYAALIACAASISGGYACWGYGMLHGSMETLAIGSYATPLFSTASSTLLLGVALGMPFWIGVVLVVAGSLINVWFARCP